MDDQTNIKQDESTSPSGQPDQSISAPSASSPTIESVKKEAMEALAPLIDSMDAPPERKFEIVMTAIRTNFDEALLRKALEAAKAIAEPSAKAEALIDVINEANYQESET